MNTWEVMDYADTAMTIAQVALVVGCPVGGMTWLAARVLIKQSAKLALKRYALAGVAGVTATTCAAFLSGTNGEGEGQSNVPLSLPGISKQSLEVETIVLLLELDESDTPIVRLGERVIPRDQIFVQLYPLLTFGKLRRVEYQNHLPEGQYGEWPLLMREIGESLQNIEPGLTFVESK